MNFVNLAKYQINGGYWNYLKTKGPCFIIIDKYSQLKIVILNQCSKENFIIHVQKGMQFELVDLQKNHNLNGYLLNYSIEDSITGMSIHAIWTTSPQI